MSNLNQTSLTYSLPLKLAFLDRRWAAFWDVLYYCASDAPRLDLTSGYPSPLPPGPVVDLKLSSRRFCQLLWGLPAEAPLPVENWESGRKAYRELTRLAHQYGLLHHVSEDEDDELLSYGVQATNRLWLIPPGDGSIVKPRALVENGWLARCGNRYERHLLNLSYHQPGLFSEASLPVLARKLLDLYREAATSLPEPLHPRPTDGPALRRQLGQAYSVLQVRGLLTGGSNLPQPPAHTVEDSQDPRMMAYARKDPARTQQLKSLLATGNLASHELKAAWTTLAKFPQPDDFNLLRDILQRRATIPNLSWRQVEASAQARRSKRGTRTDLPTDYKPAARRYLNNRLENIPFGSSRLVRLPVRPSFDLARQRPARTRLQIWSRVAQWSFGAEGISTSKEPTPPAQLKLRLLDSAGVLLYQSDPFCISPTTPTTTWKYSLDKVFSQPQPLHDFSLLYLELEQLSPARCDWLTLSLRLTYFN